LTALRVRAEMVDDEDTRTSLVASSEEMQRMVDATLDFAKGVGQHEEVQSVDLHDLITGMGLDKVQVTSQGPLIVSVKPSAMGRALRNLIENAIRYGSEARVSWQRMGSEVVVAIDDQGPGIPDNQLEAVFGPYVRLETSRSQDTGGHGLGLSIARSIILEHGGSIELKNRTDGGLRAEITLPVKQSAESAPKEEGSPHMARVVRHLKPD